CAIKCHSVRHISAGHRTPEAVGHIGTRSMDGQSVMERAAPGFHGNTHRRQLPELRIEIEDGIHVLSNTRILKSSVVIRSGDKIQASVLRGGVVKGYPDRQGTAIGERPERCIKMPGSRVGPWPFDQCLIVPDTYTI